MQYIFKKLTCVTVKVWIAYNVFSRPDNSFPDSSLEPDMTTPCKTAISIKYERWNKQVFFREIKTRPKCNYDAYLHQHLFN